MGGIPSTVHCGMTFDTFERTVAAMLDDVPEVFLTDLQGVHVLPDAMPEEDGEVFRMGEYLDPGPDAFLGGDEGLGRHVALYYGSFVRVAQGDPDFDWEEEIWETLTHELQHHVESLAGDGRLIEEDLIRDRAFAATTTDEHTEERPSGPWWQRLFQRRP